MSILQYRQTIDKNLNRLTYLNTDAGSLAIEILNLEREKIEIEEMLAISRKAAGIVQDKLCERLSHIVTRVIQTVFDDTVSFIIRFVERRGVSEADMFVVDGAGNEYDILESRGGGLADVVSLALQLSFILLSDVDRWLILDEPARHVSKEAQKKFGEVLKMLVKEFGFTALFVTHSQDIEAIADRVFKVEIEGGVSRVSQQV